MAGFNINETNKSDYKEIAFKNGLEHIKANQGKKLYSDGLEFGEYIHYVKDHYEYEDGCSLGINSYEIVMKTGGSNSWILSHKFYVRTN